MISKLELYAIIGAAWLAALIGAYFYGVGVGRDGQLARDAKAQSEAIAARDKAEQERDAIAERFANIDVTRQNTVREVYREIPRIIQGSPVYRNVCVDDGGVRALDRAAAAANGKPVGEPAGGPGGAAGDAAHDRPGHGQGDDHRRPVP